MYFWVDLVLNRHIALCSACCRLARFLVSPGEFLDGAWQEIATWSPVVASG
ncbi:hypothetical protein A2U01_0112012, partial [Trifolium medium]|nr:hypothetical protein [Trifolium medium]